MSDKRKSLGESRSNFGNGDLEISVTFGKLIRIQDQESAVFLTPRQAREAALWIIEHATRPRKRRKL